MQSLLLECTVRAALIAAGTSAVLFALRVKSPAARHAAWLGVVVWMLVLPAWTAWVPKASMRVLPAVSRPAVFRAMPVSTTPLPEAPNPQLGDPLPQRPAWNWLLTVYLLGAGVLLSRLAIGTARALALLRTVEKRDDHWTSSACTAPVTVGWLHPIVILPEGWPGWSAAQLAAVLAHEREHARRLDPLMQFLALLNRALFWFHPLAWWLERRLSALAEESCDASVLASGHDPYDYSCYLLEIARAVERTGMRVNVLGMAMPGSALPRRIRQILSAHPAQPITRARALFAAAACLLVSAAFAAGALERAKPRATPLVPAMRPMVAMAPPAPIPLASSAAPAAPSPQTETKYLNRRLLVLFFDMAVMDDADRARAASAAQKFVQTQMQASDLVSIMVSNGAVKVMQDFTDDREVLLQTLGQLPDVVSGTPDPDRLLQGLRTAVGMLEPLKQKKALVYFTKGVQRDSSHSAELQELIDAAVRANVAFYPVDVQGLPAKPPAPQEPVPAPVFEAASVKRAQTPESGGPRGIWSPDPSRVTGRNATLGEAIRYAFNVRPYQVSGPVWLEDERYDIEAKAAGAGSPDQRRQMMQTLLAERFRLSVHRENKDLTVYEMTVAQGGPKMPAAKDLTSVKNPDGAYTTFHVGTAEAFARVLSNRYSMEIPIIDKTGLTGSYQFALSVEPGQDFVAALQEQLGLKLTPKKAPTGILVIDHVEKIPTEN